MASLYFLTSATRLPHRLRASSLVPCISELFVSEVTQFLFIKLPFDMHLLSLFKIAILVLQCSAASIQPWLQLNQGAPPIFATFASNQTSLTGPGLTDVLFDPRFHIVTVDGSRDLSDKSTVMTCPKALYEISPYDPQHLFVGSRSGFSNAQYGSV